MITSRVTSDNLGRAVLRIEGKTWWANYDPGTAARLADSRQTGPGWGAPMTWYRRADRMAQAIISRWPSGIPAGVVYIRFGGLPDGGRSYNHAERRLESGTSVIAAIRILEHPGRYRLVPYGSSPTFLWIADRPIYLVDGVRAGRGADGEPLLQEVRIVANIDRRAVRLG